MTLGNSNLHEKLAHLWTPKITLNLNTILYIIKCIFYCIFLSLVFVKFLSPQLFWHCSPFFRCFPVTITPLFQNTGSCSFISLTTPFLSFTVVFSSTSLISFFLLGSLFCFASLIPLLSLLLFHTDSYLPFLFLCEVFSLFISLLLPFYFLYFSYFCICFLSVISLNTPLLKGKNQIWKKW